MSIIIMGITLTRNTDQGATNTNMKQKSWRGI